MKNPPAGWGWREGVSCCVPSVGWDVSATAFYWQTLGHEGRFVGMLVLAPGGPVLGFEEEFHAEIRNRLGRADVAARDALQEVGDAERLWNTGGLIERFQLARLEQGDKWTTASVVLPYQIGERRFRVMLLFPETAAFEWARHVFEDALRRGTAGELPENAEWETVARRLRAS